jgi:hypothetical protein
MPNKSQINWVALKVKMRCSRSGSLCDVLTADIRFPFDIVTFFLAGCCQQCFAADNNRPVFDLRY